MLTPGFKDMLNGMRRRVRDLRRKQGQRSPKLSTLYTLAKALDCDMRDFFA
ncbi:hypothetical protein [Bifidobacterium sp. ESL0764]|uniref:hypothetical protein n=1 Tax=Bifidobacterium sp. ESL0764 TaxID=2983228 RepID=UPI0023F61B1B|nr:hypothetical protein [Bifidobacterium sp. ESL0764]WEV66008.1 hypothetical protein OZX71_01210 [Bifidobacterium sp. ESL0764]